MGPIPAKWKGNCNTAQSFSPTNCNRSPRDIDGHDTYTAAGNLVIDNHRRREREVSVSARTNLTHCASVLGAEVLHSKEPVLGMCLPCRERSQLQLEREGYQA